MTTSVLQHRSPAPRRWPVWAFDAILWILFLGPIISPLFRASGLPLVAESGQLARDVLATFVCPTPERSHLLFGLPMAVCARCWGATIGLWAARVVVDGRHTERLPGATRLLDSFRAMPGGRGWRSAPRRSCSGRWKLSAITTAPGTPLSGCCCSTVHRRASSPGCSSARSGRGSGPPLVAGPPSPVLP